MTSRWMALAVCILAGSAGAPAGATVLVEEWRRPIGRNHALSLNTSDGSVWATTGSSITHVAADGTVLSKTDGFWCPMSVSANSSDGTCWVADFGNRHVVKLDADGTVMVRVGGFGYIDTVSANPLDGSCWVSDWDNREIIHLDADGGELLRKGDMRDPSCVVVNPFDGSCWVSRRGGLMRLSSDGTEIWRKEEFSGRHLCPDPRDGSCWFFGGEYIYRISADGAVLWQRDWEYGMERIAVNTADGSYWTTGVNLVHWAADDTELSRRSKDPYWGGDGNIAVDPSDGSIWLTGLVHCGEDGEGILRVEGTYNRPRSISANPVDGSFWVADPWAGEVAHLDRDATELWRGGGFNKPVSVSVNPADGSCWVVDTCEFEGNECPDPSVVHLAQDGTILWRGANFVQPVAASVNRTDGSCWVADEASGDVVCLAADGTELWRGGGLRSAEAIAASYTDSSCWVAGEPAPGGQQLVRFAADGAELASVHFTVGIRGIAVDPRDGSCWIGAGGEVLRVGADGSVLSRTGGDLFPTHLWVDPSDGSCWASDGVACGARPLLSVGKLVHLAPDGTRLGEIGGFDSAGPILSGGDGAAPVFAADTWNGQVVCLRRGFHDVPKSHWAFEAIMACVDAGIVAGYPDGRYRPDRPVTRDQMAVYIARAIAGGDMSVPAAAGDANFPDVLEDFWAYRHIQYAAASNVVAGYEDGLYHPEYEVTRDQMAVYVARALVAPTGEAALADYVPADPHNFPDVPDTFWAYKHIEYCVENDVVMGYEDGLYHPYVVVTRDQMAVYIARAFDLLT